jgi:hypothetical protein
VAKIEVRYVRGDDERVVVITPLAILGWEKESGRRLSDLSKGMGIGDMAIMAMTQERLEGRTEATKVEDWLAGVDELGPKDDEAPVAATDPTEGEASEGP